MAVEYSIRTERVRRLYTARGIRHYGEGVSQTQHAVQSYRLAQEAGAELELRVAAFVHDIGHLLVPEKHQEVDMSHEVLGAEWLKIRGFCPLVVALVQSHVWAKRYLASDPEYYAELSDASKASLVLQGGVLSNLERSSYEQLQHFGDALALRRWDDLAKEASDLASHQIPDEVWFDFTLYDQKFPL
jgi:putative nucleotidyltransferase with HDIG domain